MHNTDLGSVCGVLCLEHKLTAVVSVRERASFELSFGLFFMKSAKSVQLYQVSNVSTYTVDSLRYLRDKPMLGCHIIVVRSLFYPCCYCIIYVSLQPCRNHCNSNSGSTPCALVNNLPLPHSTSQLASAARLFLREAPCAQHIETFNPHVLKIMLPSFARLGKVE